MNTFKRLSAWLSTPSAVYFIFGLYILPRVAILLIPVKPFSDAAWYFNTAAGLAQGKGYSEGGILTAFWPPGWPMMLSVIFKPFGISLLMAQLFNLACATLTGWLTMDLGRRLFQSEAAGRMALLLLAVYPNNIAYVPLVWTEVFYATLLLAGCWVLVVWRSSLGLFLAGLVFGAATLVKAQSLVVIPMIFGIAFLRGRFGVQQVSIAIAKTAAVVLIAALVVFPWSYRNYKVFGEWVPVSTNGGLTLLTGNNPSARGDYTADDPLVTTIARTVETQLDVDKVARERALAWIRDNPGSFVALMPLKIFRLWAPDGEAEWSFQAGSRIYENNVFFFRAARYINQAYYACLLIGFAFAGLLLLSQKVKISPGRFDWWLLPYAIAMYPTVIALVFSGQSRFHYPVMPFVTMCCGWLLVWCINRPQSATSPRG